MVWGRRASEEIGRALESAVMQRITAIAPPFGSKNDTRIAIALR
jgi:hypothetical protein